MLVCMSGLGLVLEGRGGAGVMGLGGGGWILSTTVRVWT